MFFFLIITERLYTFQFQTLTSISCWSPMETNSLLLGENSYINKQREKKIIMFIRRKKCFMFLQRCLMKRLFVIIVKLLYQREARIYPYIKEKSIFQNSLISYFFLIRFSSGKPFHSDYGEEYELKIIKLGLVKRRKQSFKFKIKVIRSQSIDIYIEPLQIIKQGIREKAYKRERQK